MSSDRPLVSIITPTWGRPDLLLETVEHVRRQSYRPLEHIVVLDGPLGESGYGTVARLLHGHSQLDLPVRFATLGWRPTAELRDSFAVGALTMGALMARGEYHMWLCDDERMAVNHVELLAGMLDEDPGLDFVYPLVYTWRPGDPDGGLQIGSDPPRLGTITSVLYRRRVLDKGMYRFHIPLVPGTTHAVHDWDIVNRWVRNGARWAMLERETLSHRTDH